MPRLLTALITWNACAWPYVFAAYAWWIGDYYRLFGYVAVGAIFGSCLLLLMALGLVVLASWFPDKQFTSKVLEASVPARKLAGGACILLAIGTGGLVSECFRYKPAFERLGR